MFTGLHMGSPWATHGLPTFLAQYPLGQCSPSVTLGDVLGDKDRQTYYWATYWATKTDKHITGRRTGRHRQTNSLLGDRLGDRDRQSLYWATDWATETDKLFTGRQTGRHGQNHILYIT